jgi:hypothetical protein
VLASRDRERSAIRQLLELARNGGGGGLLLRGEPGIGKSALLADAREQASDMRVLQATRRSRGEHGVSGLPASQRQALYVALGLELGGHSAARAGRRGRFSGGRVRDQSRLATQRTA